MRNLATQAARLMAICGGLVLTVLIVLICISVIGRSLNGLLHGWIGALMPGVSAWALDLGVGPINGDFELVEAGVAFAIFAFLPLCQISAGHASVDIFTAKLPTRINRVLQLAIDVIFAACPYRNRLSVVQRHAVKTTLWRHHLFIAISDLVGLCRQPVRIHSHSGHFFICGGYSCVGTHAW
jgi:hypothetical protein